MKRNEDASCLSVILSEAKNLVHFRFAYAAAQKKIKKNFKPP